MAIFDVAVSFILQNEGILNENAKDKGGITKYGISLRFLKSLSVEELKRVGLSAEIDEQTIRDLKPEQARQIYYFQFWLHARFADIESQDQANYLFDMAINLGIAPAVKCIQRAIWAVMKRWDLLVDDGILGDKTLAALHKCGFLLMPALRAERANYYRNIVNLHPDQKEFFDGWLNRTYSN